MAYSFDGLDLTASPYSVRWVSEPYRSAPRQHILSPFGTRPGAALLERAAGPLALRLVIGVRATSQSVFESRCDTLLTTLARPRRRLIATAAGTRAMIATATVIETAYVAPTYGTVAVEFAAEDAYQSALTPAASVTTPTLALLAGETTAYGLAFSLTPGGSAATPVRWLLTNQAAGVTPLLWEVRNHTTGQALATVASVPAGSCLFLDPTLGAYAGSLASVAGFWPLGDTDGPARDFSANSRDLTEGGTVTFLQDGPDQFSTGGRWLGALPAAGFDGSTSNLLSSTSSAFELATLSLTCWVRVTALPGTRAVLLSKAGTNQGYSLALTPTTWEASIGTGAAATTASYTSTPATSVWYFVALTMLTASRLRLYLGTEYQAPRLVAAASAGTITNSSNDLRIGAGNFTNGTQYALTGRIALPAVYSAELTADQIYRVWQRGPQAYDDDPVTVLGAYPDLDPGAGTTNVVQVRADHGTTAPTPRVAALWRGRYQ